MSLKFQTPEIALHKYLDYRAYLRDLYAEYKKVTKPFSYEAFSEVLGFKRTNYMYQIINNLRPLTEKSAKKIASAIPLKNWDRKYFLTIVAFGHAKKAADREELFQKIISLRSEKLKSDLDKSMLSYFSEWYHPVVRELVELPQFNPEPKWIASQLNPPISEDEASQSFQLLQRIGYITYNPSLKKWEQSQPVVSMPREVASIALIRYHQQLLDKAKESIINIPAKEREIAALTMTLSNEDFKKLKTILQEFRKQIIEEFAEAKNPERVAQFNMQLFPLSEIQNQDEEK